MYDNGKKARTARAVLACAAALMGVGVVPAGEAAAAVAPTVVNAKNREEVRRSYLTTYRATTDIEPSWTGNVANCEPGTLSAAFLNATQTRLNWFRAMAGVSSTVEFTPENNAKAQSAALLQAANPGQFEHNPPPTWRCYTPAAAAASISNLGGTGPGAIDGWMQEAGANNRATGHRRHILNPGQLTMGHGGVPGGAGALFVFGNAVSPAPGARDGFVAWPPAGFVPSPTVYGRWSFSLPPTADVSNATVTMSRPNGVAAPLEVLYRESNSGYGDSAITWHPLGVGENDVWPTPMNDETFTVVIAGINIGGVTRTISYDVTIFDPALGDPARTPARISGPLQPPVGEPSRYEVTAVPNALGYQRRTMSLTPLPQSDGAEEGLVNFDAEINEYNPISTAFAASGTSSFRLSIGQPGPREFFASQTLTFKGSIAPSATSRLTFQTRAVAQANLASFAEVSTDGGATWTTLLDDRAADDAAFVPRSFALGAFLNQAIKLRFRTVYTFNGGNIGGGGATGGWYVDDVAISDAFRGAVTVDELGANPDFTLTPTDAVLRDVAVRPQFFGPFLGEWGPPIRLAPKAPAVGPAITTQPQAIRVEAGQGATFSVEATGTDPLTFQWSRNGVELVDGGGVTGTRTAKLRLERVAEALAGSYAVRVTNTAGTVVSSAVLLTVDSAPPPVVLSPLATAVDNFAADWKTSGDAPWASQTGVSRDGVSAARSGTILDGQRSVLEAAQLSGPATVSFWWKADSEVSFDFLTVEVDGVAPFAGISGNVDWEQRSFTIPAGTHTLRWHYSKDESVSVGQDAGWVDQVVVTRTPR